MNDIKNKILVLGLGNLEKELIGILSEQWQLIAVDNDEQLIETFCGIYPGVQCFHGDAGSRVTWKHLELERVKFIISGIADVDVNTEVCRIARSVYKLKIPIIVLDYGGNQQKLTEQFGATLVNPLTPGIQVIMKYIDKNVAHAVNIGLGKGELIEVSIKARSHLVDRKLKYLRPTRWHISAIYREGKLILPEGNCKLKVGDRVVLAGNPKVLENVVAILLKGLPQFPLQYGTDIVFPLQVDFSGNMDEAVFLLKSFKAQRIAFLPFRHKLSPALTVKIKEQVPNFHLGETIELYKEIFNIPMEPGVLVVPLGHWGVRYARIRRTFRKARFPFLLSRMSFPYENVVISLNGPDPVQALETGIEMAKLMDVPYKVVYVCLPKEMRGKEDEQKLLFRRQVVSDFEGIHQDTIQYTELKGNPVKETLKYLQTMKKGVLVMINNPNAPISFFQPNVAYLVARKTHLSTLIIPEASTDE